jgi:hypothetical protein
MGVLMNLASKSRRNLLTTVDRDSSVSGRRSIGSAISNQSAMTNFSFRRSLTVLLFFACLTTVGSISVGQDESSPAIEIDVQPEKPKPRPSTQPAIPQDTATTPKVVRYARHLLVQYDRNRDGRLQQNEWHAMKGQPEFIDEDGDGEISLEELIRWVADYGRRKRIGVPVGIDSADSKHPALQSDTRADDDPSAKPSNVESSIGSPGERRRDLKFYVPTKRLPPGLPDWFLAKDIDGDGQLTAGEFSPAGLAAELAEFSSYDANGDGVLTAKECVRKSSGKPAARSKEPDK